jgi:hypothetical protein
MNPRLQPALNWWAERNLRERLLLLTGATAAVLVAGDSLLTTPMERRLRQGQGQLQEQAGQLEQLRADNGPGAEAQRQRALAVQLQARVQTATASTLRLRQQAAEAARLPETLRAITATVGSARLLALDLSGDPGGAAATAAAAVAIGQAPGVSTAAAGVAAPPPAAGAGAPPRLYRLPITLKVSGSYEELHMLLTQIERHAEALQWSQLTLESSNWPAIQLTLKAHVLSPEPRWGAAS